MISWYLVLMKSAAGLGGITPVDTKFNMGPRFSFSSVIFTVVQKEMKLTNQKD